MVSAGRPVIHCQKVNRKLRSHEEMWSIHHSTVVCMGKSFERMGETGGSSSPRHPFLDVDS